MQKKVSKLWVRRKCDRCGEIKFVRPWNGVVKMCEECAKIADKESQE